MVTETDTQTLRQVAQTRTPFSVWLGVVLLFLMFGLIVLAVVGPTPRYSDFERKRAANRETKLKALREQDTTTLTTYGWVDKNKGTVRIPIDRAMELAVVELGRKKPAPAGPIATPAAASPAPAAAGGVATPPAAPAPATQPGASASPGASSAPAAVPPSSPPPLATPSAPGTPLPVRDKSPEGQ